MSDFLYLKFINKFSYSDKLRVNLPLRKNTILSMFLFFVFIFMNAMTAFAGPRHTTYQAKIIKPDGLPLEAANVNFKFSILDPAGACVVYAETFSSVNMSGAGGLISFSLGSGVRTYPVSATTFEQAFSNITPSLSCDAGGPVSYSPLADDDRKIVMQFHDGGGWQTLPPMSINAVPYAMYANDAQKLGGVSATAFVQDTDLATCAGGQALFYNGTSFSCVAVGGGGVTSSTISVALGYTPADDAGVATIASNVSSVSTTVFSVSSTVASLSNSVTTLTNTVAASFAAIVNSQWVTSGTTISYLSGKVGIGTSDPKGVLDVSSSGTTNLGSVTGLPLQLRGSGSDTTATGLAIYNPSNPTGSYFGITFSGASFTGTRLGVPNLSNGVLLYGNSAATQPVSFVAIGTSTAAPIYLSTNNVIRQTITPIGYVGIGTSTPVTKLDVSGGVRIGMEAASCDAALAGTLRYTSGNVEYCNGITWAAFGTGGAITSSSIAAALSYTPANTTTVEASFTTLTNLFNTTSTSVTTLTSTVNNLSSSYAVLASAVSGIANSQWVSSGTAISYTNGNVGIGTSSPTSLLHLFSDTTAFKEIKIDAARNNSGGYGISFVKSRGDATSRTQTLAADTLADINFTGWTSSGTQGANPSVRIRAVAAEDLTTGSLAGSLTFQTTATASTLAVERMRIDSQGNVGIGTTTPTINSTNATTLHIHNSLGKAAGMRFTNSGTGTTATDGVVIGKWNDDSSYGNGPIFWNYEFSPITFATSSTERMVISAEGNVGIGVTSPTAALHIKAGTSSSASLKLTSGTLLTSPQSGTIEYDGFNFYTTNGAGVRSVIGAGSSGVSSTMSLLDSMATFGSGHKTVMGGYDPNGLVWHIGVSGTQALDINSRYPGGPITMTIGGSEMMRVMGSNGFVGIGTQTPMQKLDVHGYMRSASGTGGATGDGGRLYFGLNYTGTTTYDMSHIGGYTHFAGDDGSGAGAAGGLIFATKAATGASVPTERMRIDSVGNVGVGIDVPLTPLHVQKNAPQGLVGYFQGVGSGGTVVGTNPGLPTSGGMVQGLDSNGAVGTLAINPMGGNVVIGAASAAKGKLVIDDSTQNAARIVLTGQEFYQAGNSSTDGVALLAGVNRTGNRQLWISDSANLTQNASNTVARIGISESGVDFSSLGTDGVTTKSLSLNANDGNIGINTTAPRQNLDIAPAAGNAIVRATTTNAAAALQLYQNLGGDNYQGPVLWSNGTNLNFGHDTSENAGPTLMTLTTSGYLGVGTLTPSDILHVRKSADARALVDSLTGSSGLELRTGSVSSAGGGYIDFASSATSHVSPDFDFRIISTSDGLNFQTPGANTSILITAAGDVGIGTTTPLKKLHVASGSMIGTTDGFPATYATVHNEFNSGVLKKWTETTGNHVNAGTYSLVAPASASTKSSHSLVNILFTDIPAGVSSTGTNNSFYNFASRNRYVGNTDSGHVNSLVGFRNEYGHENGTPGNTPTTTSIYGSIFTPHVDSGTVSYLFDLFIAAPTGTGTLGKHYSIYQAGASATNVFNGRMGLGTETPDGALHIVSTGLHANSPASGIFFGKSLADDYQMQLTQNGGTPHFDFSRLSGRDYDARISAPANSTLSLGTASQSMLLNLYNTHVGIGTLTPTRALQVGTTGAWQDGSGILIKGSNPGLEMADTQTTPQRWLMGNGVLVPNDGNLGLAYNVNTTTHNIVVTSGGMVGIGTMTPDEKFVVNNGTTIGRYTVGGWVTTSDRRYKHDINLLDDSLNKILQLRGVEYKFNNDPENKNQLGFIAQEVEPIFPEVVSTDKKGFKSMVYSNLVAPLVEAVKSLYVQLKENSLETRQNSRKIASLQQENEKLKNENLQKAKELDDVKSRLERLEKILNSNQKSH